MTFSSIVLAALLSSSPRVHSVEGQYPEVGPANGAATLTVTIAYPVIDGGRVDRYAGSFEVRVDPALRAVIHAAGDGHPGIAGGHIRLERRDGEKIWHVVAFSPAR